MRKFCRAVVLACSAVAVACGGGKGPTGPTPATPTLSRTTFLAFGDSFTAGEVTSPMSSPGTIGTLVLVPSASYPAVLQAMLGTAYPTQSAVINVTNAGMPGEQLLEGLARFDETFSASRAEVVLIQEGANGLRLVGPDTSTGIVRIMAQSAKAGNARVFVGSMIPVVSGRPRAQITLDELVAYNVRLQEMCRQENITYVDLYGAMLSDAAALIGSDGLHPTEAGYRRMAETFFASIRPALEVR